MSTRAAIYCRISETDLNVDKPENQLRDCLRLCEEAGYEVAATFRDDGISAYKKDAVRPEYERMKRAVAAGGIDVLVAVAQDRLTRGKWEPYVLAELCDDHGVRWHTAAEGVIDFEADSMGGVRVGFTGSQNTAESKNKARRVSAANAHRRAAGLPISGPRPFGFEVDRIRHRENEADEIRWAYSVILGGGSLYRVLKEWNSRGMLPSTQADAPEALARLAEEIERREGIGLTVTPAMEKRRQRLESMTQEPTGWSYATLQQLLRRARNAALVEHDGQIIEDTKAVWEPIVSREDWSAVVGILSDPQRRVTPDREPRWLCSGLATCSACGEALRSGRGSGPKGSFPIYRCGSRGRAAAPGMRHVSVRCEQLDEAVSNAVVSAFLMGPAKGMPDDPSSAESLTAQQVRLSEVRQGLADLASLVGTPGFTRATVDRRAAELASEEEELVTALNERIRNDARAAMFVDARDGLFAGSRVSFTDAAEARTALRERFDSLPLEQRRTLIRATVTVEVGPGRSTDRIDITHNAVPSLNAGDAVGA